MRRAVYFVVSFAAAFTLVGSALLIAQTPPAPPKKSDPSVEPNKVEVLRAQAWSAMFGGNYKQVQTLADQLLHSPDERLKRDVLHCQARALWASGERNSQTQATKIWAALAKSAHTPTDQARQKIVEAITQPSGDSGNAKAIGILESALKDKLPGILNAEASLALANVYAKTGRFNDAQRLLDSIGYNLHKDNLTRLEIDSSLADAFVKAASKAKDDLKYLRNTGLEAFEKAEALRKADKFAEAYKTYQGVVKSFPTTDYAPRSELAMGMCLVEMEKFKEAAEQWKKFIAQAPAGPWRGQAYVGLIDLHLQRLLDLPEAVKYIDMATPAIATAMADEKLGASWQSVPFDLYARMGMVKLIQGDGPAASDIFNKAIPLAPSHATKEAMNRLGDAAKAGQAVIPEDVGGKVDPSKTSADRAVMALSAGILYHVIGQDDLAEGLFERISKDQSLRASSAQLAFANYGKALILQSRNKLDEAKALLLTALHTYPSGSWHDESLCQAAVLVQAEAETKFSKKSDSSSPETETAASERVSNFAKTKGEAISYWRELTKKFPKSPRTELALYNLGVDYCEIAEATPSEQAEPVWKEAASTFNRLTEGYPKSVYTGAAYVRQVDIALERMFDLPKAQELATAGGPWIKTYQVPSALQFPSEVAWRQVIPNPNSIAIQFCIYDLRLRGIFAAYLAEKYDTAKELLAAAGPMIPGDGRIDATALQKVGLFFLQRAILNRKPVWRPEALAAATTDPQRTALKLADMYFRVMRTGKAEAIYQRILDHDTAFSPTVRTLEVYACIQLARSYSYDSATMPKALSTLQMLYRPEYAREPQVADGILWLATLTHNVTQDPKKTLPHLEYIIRNYPNDPVTERATYFYCLNAVEANDKPLTETACKSFLERYPKSMWAKHVDSLLNNDVAHLTTQERIKK